MRVIFMGSPEFALPSLEVLAAEYNVVGVYTQPDRRSGRGRKLKEPPVKSLAKELGLSIYQPTSLRSDENLETTRKLEPDLIIVAAYGMILPPEILSIPSFGCINIHASLLPRWRGAAPVQAAILSGDSKTGVSIMQMDAGLDTGPVYSQHMLDIHENETGGELAWRLAELGAKSLQGSLPSIISGDLTAMPQDDNFATYAPMLKKTDGQLSFTSPASKLALQVQAYEPWPSSFFEWKKIRLVIRGAYAIDLNDHPPGTCFVHNHFPAVAANPGALVITSIQPAGKKIMGGDTFLNGAKDFPHGRITNSA